MNKKTNHKGFTITELVIVIAVVAILAAVLIPTFVSLIKKANTSADIQMVRNFNTIVAMETAMTNGEISPHEAIVAVAENGYKIEYITPTADERTIVFDAANYRFALLDEEGKEIYPKDKKSGTDKSNLFVVSDTYPAANYDGYAVYLTAGYTGNHVLNVTTGVDVGYNELITQIVYTGEKEVAIRGNEHTAIQVNSGVVHHYDIALSAHVNGGEYVEHGKLLAGQSDGTIPDAAGFAGGAGTKENPYLIANAEQFANLVAAAGSGAYQKSIKLLCDIDYSQVSNTNETVLYYLANAVFDGNGHTIKLNEGQHLCEWSQNSTFKNIVFDATNGSYLTMYAYVGTTNYENIKVVADQALNLGNVGIFCTQVRADAKVRFVDCVNEADLVIAGDGAGIFISHMPYANTELYFENCVNKGKVQGASIAFFYANQSQSVSVVEGLDYGSYVFPEAELGTNKLTVINCRNEGVLIGTKACEPFGGLGAKYSPNMRAIQAKSLELFESYDQFSRGMMIVSSVAIGFDVEGDKVVIVPGEGVGYYEYTLQIMGHCFEKPTDTKSLGEYNLRTLIRIEADEVADWSIENITDSYASNVYDETATVKYADIPAANKRRDDSLGIEYAIVSNGDNTYSLVVNYDEFLAHVQAENVDCGYIKIYNPGAYHCLEAYSAEGNLLGRINPKINQLPYIPAA